MLKAQKKLTRRQIKEDKFVTYYFKTQEYVRENGQTILYGIGIVAAILIASLIFSSKSAEKEQSAVVQLTQAKLEYFNNNYAAAIPILNNLISSYGGTASGHEARYYLGNSHFNNGDHAEAEKYFKEYLEDGGDEVLQASATAGIAASLEEQKNYAAAAEFYSEAARKYSEVFLAAETLYNSARCHVLAGNTEQARSVLSLLLEKYPDSSIKNEAEIFLAELM